MISAAVQSADKLISLSGLAEGGDVWVCRREVSVGCSRRGTQAGKAAPRQPLVAPRLVTIPSPSLPTPISSLVCLQCLAHSGHPVVMTLRLRVLNLAFPVMQRAGTILFILVALNLAMGLAHCQHPWPGAGRNV